MCRPETAQSPAFAVRLETPQFSPRVPPVLVGLGFTSSP